MTLQTFSSLHAAVTGNNGKIQKDRVPSVLRLDYTIYSDISLTNIVAHERGMRGSFVLLLWLFSFDIAMRAEHEQLPGPNELIPIFVVKMKMSFGIFTVFFEAERKKEERKKKKRKILTCGTT